MDAKNLVIFNDTTAGTHELQFEPTDKRRHLHRDMDDLNIRNVTEDGERTGFKFVTEKIPHGSIGIVFEHTNGKDAFIVISGIKEVILEDVPGKAPGLAQVNHIHDVRFLTPFKQPANYSPPSPPNEDWKAKQHDVSEMRRDDQGRYYWDVRIEIMGVPLGTMRSYYNDDGYFTGSTRL